MNVTRSVQKTIDEAGINWSNKWHVLAWMHLLLVGTQEMKEGMREHRNSMSQVLDAIPTNTTIIKPLNANGKIGKQSTEQYLQTWY